MTQRHGMGDAKARSLIARPPVPPRESTRAVAQRAPNTPMKFGYDLVTAALSEDVQPLFGALPDPAFSGSGGDYVVTKMKRPGSLAKAAGP